MTPKGVLLPKEALGSSDAGFDPTEEERKSKEGGGEHKSTLQVVSEEECKQALADFLNPPVSPFKIEQSIRSVFLERPEKSIKHVVLLSEVVPSWLAAADSWGAQQLFLYCEKEVNWYRSNLEVVTPLTSFHTVAGIARGPWVG